MAKLRFTAEARRDLREVAEHGADQHGLIVSARYMNGFPRLFRLLREQPFAGQARPEFARGIRSLSHRPYRLLYRVEADVVIVERIIHQARDVGRALEGEE